MFQLGTWLGEGINWLYTVAGPLGGLILYFLRIHRDDRYAPGIPALEMSLWAAGRFQLSSSLPPCLTC